MFSAAVLRDFSRNAIAPPFPVPPDPSQTIWSAAIQATMDAASAAKHLNVADSSIATMVVRFECAEAFLSRTPDSDVIPLSWAPPKDEATTFAAIAAALRPLVDSPQVQHATAPHADAWWKDQCAPERVFAVVSVAATLGGGGVDVTLLLVPTLPPGGLVDDDDSTSDSM